jgi:hypothetical protein
MNEWQGKLKCSKKTCTSAALSTADAMQNMTRAAVVGSQQLTT